MPAYRRSLSFVVWLSFALLFTSGSSERPASGAMGISSDTHSSSPRPALDPQKPLESSGEQTKSRAGRGSKPEPLQVTLKCGDHETTKKIDNALIKMEEQVPVTVCVTGLQDYAQKQGLRLSIGGQVLSILPTIGPSDRDYLNFILQFNKVKSDDWQAWAEILQASLKSDDSEGKPLAITVTDGKEVFKSEAFVEIKLSSCADLPEAALMAQESREKEQQSPGGSRSEPVTLKVVQGWSPLDTTDFTRMGQQVTVCVMNLNSWTKLQTNHLAKLRLSIGGQVLSMPPTIGPSDQEYLNFILRLDKENSDDWKTWAQILEASRQNVDSEGKHTLPITVADGSEVFESEAFVEIDPYPEHWYLILGFLLFLLVALIYLAARTDLLRSAAGEKPSLPLRAPYSLGIAQMSFWFYLAVAAYVFIFATTHQAHIPMGSVLGLLGISSTTGLAAIFVDKGKDASAQNQKNTLLTEQAALSARINDLTATGVTPGSAAETELRDKTTRLSQVRLLVAQLPPAPPPPTSKGLIVDLLNDGDGVSFHRFQIAVWTIVLGFVFVWSVYRNISMPEFDASLLTLMGISAGTYVGFKFPEKPKT